MPKSSVYFHIGKKFNRLTILSIVDGNSQLRKVIAKCDCGIIKDFYLTHIMNNKSKSCGCLSKEIISKIKTIHGLTGHPLYSVWTDIKTRCYNKNRKQYKNYGGRGVTICNEWKNDFKCFFDWAIKNGWRKGLELDKDILGNGLIYSPSNCCFVTKINNIKAKKIIKGRPIKQFIKQDGSSINSKRIYCVNNTTTYNSINEAALILKLNKSSISKVLSGQRSSLFGYKFTAPID